MRVLVTGFDAFGGESINPAYEAVRSLKDHISGAEIIKKEIPTIFNKSIEILEKLIMDQKPNIIICIGQAGGRSDISLERVAINIDDARIKDNKGNQPMDSMIFEDGENAYFSSLPIKRMAKKIREAGIPASISNTAGTFVCNHIMYGLLYFINNKYPNIKGGFIHVPYIPEQVVSKGNLPSMSLDNIREGLELAIQVAIDYDEDIKTVEGREY